MVEAGGGKGKRGKVQGGGGGGGGREKVSTDVFITITIHVTAERTCFHLRHIPSTWNHNHHQYQFNSPPGSPTTIEITHLDKIFLDSSNEYIIRNI